MCDNGGGLSEFTAANTIELTAANQAAIESEASQKLVEDNICADGALCGKCWNVTLYKFQPQMTAL